jgi:hypothetical protein
LLCSSNIAIKLSYFTPYATEWLGPRINPPSDAFWNSPYEGWKASLNGSDGRMEIEEFYSGNRANASMQYIRIFNRSGEHIVYEISKASGVHSGGDERLRRMIFAGDINDVLGQQANSWAGTMSCMIGISANRSILEKRIVNVKELLE